ncbi:DEKNAAC103686 [Brettanomyces naardenensis]|uniref:DEKNAAC103686 n=1 Tax=Brettanomyces naardenensis TaxID=13370 RepID=A0A448YMX3_BRENA|nr:DEKNAAC103686 [Brettanomyces naardenensis]
MSTLRTVLSQLSWTDKLLPPAIIIAIILGIVISVYAPNSRKAFQGAEVLGVSVPLAIGMIVMIVPPLCRLQLENYRMFLEKRLRKQLLISLVLNWIVCPFFMLALAWMTLFDLDEYRNGIILIGLGRCIAMVLVWNQIAHGDQNLCAVLVIMNSLLQLVLYAPYKIFFCDILGGARNLNPSGQSSISELYSTVASTVGFFLGIPLALGVLIRLTGMGLFGKKVYETRIMRFISPWSTIGLLYTILVIFINKGDSFISGIGTSFRCFVPLVAYFVITWFAVFFGLRMYFGTTKERSAEQEPLCGCEKQLSEGVENKVWKKCCSSSYPDITTQSFTAASNNFELSLAVAISLYGADSSQAIAATYGPLLEIPVLLILTIVSRYFEAKFLWRDEVTSDSE